MFSHASEDNLKQLCNRAIKKERFPRFWHYCPSDKFYSGIPDYLFCADGRFGWVELKIKTGRVAPIQTFTHLKINEAGGLGKVCRDVKDFVDFIWGFYSKEERENGK